MERMRGRENVRHAIKKNLNGCRDGVFATMATLGNITDYNTILNLFSMFCRWTRSSDSAIKYRAIHDAWSHRVVYAVIIAIEGSTALLCWIGTWKLWCVRHDGASSFNARQIPCHRGHDVGIPIMAGGVYVDWRRMVRMWMSKSWNGIESAYRFFITLLGVIIYLAMSDGGIE